MIDGHKITVGIHARFRSRGINHDAERDRLQSEHPGWRVWYVPHQTGITWCAQPIPTLNEASVEDLEKAIHETETDWQNESVSV
jgi:hypothetical protein